MIYQKLYEFKKKEIKLIRNKEGFNYSYATLGQIQEKIGPVLEELNMVVTHYSNGNNVVTRITDIEDDSFVESYLDIGTVESKRIEKFTDKGKEIEVVEFNSKDPQGVGSIITYYRRYNLLELLDLETEDDDGKKGSNRAKNNEIAYNNTPSTQHTCLKCGTIVDAKLNSGQWGDYFKCSSCGQNSKANPVREKVKIKSDGPDISEMPF